jgi:cytochrome c oxidase subunit 1
MNPLLGKSFMLLTLIISVPAELLFLNWLHTIWKGSMRINTPTLFSIGVLWVFGIGGLTGLFLATISTDLFLHDTYFVVGHFHLTMAAAAFLGTLGGIYFWFPKLFGRMMNETLGKWHFWLSVITITLVFSGQLILGWGGMQRRLYDPSAYTFLAHLKPLNRGVTLCAFVLGLAQLLFAYNFIKSLVAGKKASDNPWEVGTLEWSTTSPPPHYNYKEIPVVHCGPHEYNRPGVVGRDWLGQWEQPPADATPAGAAAHGGH